MRTSSLLLFFSLFISVQTVRADVLFLDMNMSSKEIAAARKGAEARGEKLIVLPLISESSRKIIETAQGKVYQHSGFLATRCGQDTQGRTDLAKVNPALYNQCEQAKEKEHAAKDELTKLKKQHLKPLDQNSLQQELKKLKDQGVNLTSLVISGHDGHGSFFGVNGYFTATDFGKAFKENAPLGNNIRSLALWGCDSAGPNDSIYQWQPMLPNLEIIAGFDGVAPSNERKAGHDYLENFLKQEKKLTAIKDQEALKAAFKRIEGVNVVTASMCTEKNFVSSTKKSFNIKERVDRCLGPEGAEKIKKHHCIRNAEPACSQVECSRHKACAGRCRDSRASDC